MVVCTGEATLGDDNFEVHEKPLLDCLGVEKISYVMNNMVSAMPRFSGEDKKIFADFTDSKVAAVGSKFIFAELKAGAEKWTRLVPPHHFGPPERCYYTQVTDIPGISRYRYGKGAVLFGLTNIAPGLSPQVEVTAKKTESFLFSW